MKTRQIHGLGLGEFLIFAPAKEMLKSAYFFSALQFATLFLFTYLLNTAQFKKALLEWRNILHFAPKDNVNVGRLPSAGVHAYASGGAHAVGCSF